ncbi:hypothetical protein [Deminuibacter soli]|uniref:DUF4595 domain-containing protein n=1 Tax=Deminuibacter soli TaxID=2291815 RepID=A0A3E1NCI9_9BACT|nr:hypothetical protein [Deminuibacter soli]RFM25725.1 hypothetical protein DXN05_23735 [Deminuibacter soli]
MKPFAWIVLLTLFLSACKKNNPPDPTTPSTAGPDTTAPAGTDSSKFNTLLKKEIIYNGSGGITNTDTFAYDKQGRVTAFTRIAPGGTNVFFTYTYDDAKHIAYRQNSGTADGVYVFDDKNRLHQYTITGIYVTSFTYNNDRPVLQAFQNTSFDTATRREQFSYNDNLITTVTRYTLSGKASAQQYFSYDTTVQLLPEGIFTENPGDQANTMGRNYVNGKTYAFKATSAAAVDTTSGIAGAASTPVNFTYEKNKEGFAITQYVNGVKFASFEYIKQ